MNIPEITAAEAASQIEHGALIGVGGFGPAGSPKYIIPQLAQRARQEHAAGRPFKVSVVTGASIGASCDGELAEADAIDRRFPFSVNAQLRQAFNTGRVRYNDLNLSDNASHLRQGVLRFNLIQYAFHNLHHFALVCVVCVAGEVHTTF